MYPPGHEGTLAPPGEYDEPSVCCGDAAYVKLECGPMPNVMVALPNIGGALCSTPQSFTDAHY